MARPYSVRLWKGCMNMRADLYLYRDRLEECSFVVDEKIGSFQVNARTDGPRIFAIKQVTHPDPELERNGDSSPSMSGCKIPDF
jgi:hypothetical protein